MAARADPSALAMVNQAAYAAARVGSDSLLVASAARRFLSALSRLAGAWVSISRRSLRLPAGLFACRSMAATSSSVGLVLFFLASTSKASRRYFCGTPPRMIKAPYTASERFIFSTVATLAFRTA